MKYPFLPMLAVGPVTLLLHFLKPLVRSDGFMKYSDCMLYPNTSMATLESTFSNLRNVSSNPEWSDSQTQGDRKGVQRAIRFGRVPCTRNPCIAVRTFTMLSTGITTFILPFPFLLFSFWNQMLFPTTPLLPRTSSWTAAKQDSLRNPHVTGPNNRLVTSHPFAFCNGSRLKPFPPPIPSSFTTT